MRHQGCHRLVADKLLVWICKGGIAGVTPMGDIWPPAAAVLEGYCGTPRRRQQVCDDPSVARGTGGGVLFALARREKCGNLFYVTVHGVVGKWQVKALIASAG